MSDVFKDDSRDMGEYLNICRNVDNMINRFEKDRNYVVSLIDDDINKLINVLWTTESPVCIDNKCLFNMGKTHNTYTLEERIEGTNIINEGVINFHTCPQCKNMKRLLDFSKTKIGEPFLIECGSSVGDKLVIVETKINKLYAIKESPPKSVQKLLNNPHIINLSRCSAGCLGGLKDTCIIKDYNNITYLGLDPYTNNMLINWYLNKKLSEVKMSNIINMHIGYVCSGSGYSMYEYPDIGRVRHLQEYPQFLKDDGRPSPTATADTKVPLSKDVVKGIISQLFAVLSFLRKYDFSHGDPSSRSVLFKNVPCSYIYDGVHVDSPITLKLCDLHHSGITVNNKIRLYNKSVIADEEILKKSYKPIIDTVTITPFSFSDDSDKNDITIYRLKDPNKYPKESIMFMYIKHLGLPIYQSSFDAYSFMISLMTDRSFYATVMSDEFTYLLWREMWLPEEFDIIQEKIRKSHKSADPASRVDKVLRILSDLGLRCDMIDHGWDMIKKW